MSSQRYTPEFKDEAVQQVLELGFTVAEDELAKAKKVLHSSSVRIFLASASNVGVSINY